MRSRNLSDLSTTRVHKIKSPRKKKKKSAQNGNTFGALTTRLSYLNFLEKNHDSKIDVAHNYWQNLSSNELKIS